MKTESYIQFAVLLLSIFASHVYLSRQIKKSKRSEWIEKLRTEVATFCAQAMSCSMPRSTLDEIRQILKTSYSVFMLLDNTNPQHRELEQTIAKTTLIVTHVVGSDKDHKQLKELHEAVIRLSRDIIRKEIRKL